MQLEGRLGHRDFDVVSVQIDFLSHNVALQGLNPAVDSWLLLASTAQGCLRVLADNGDITLL